MDSPAIQKCASAARGVALCLLLVGGEGFAQQHKAGRTALGIELSREAEMHGVQVPFHGMDSRLEARLRMQTVSIGAKKVGFFLLGILPQVDVRKFELTIYAIDRDAVWPEKLCDLFMKEKPLADADLWDVEITTIPNYNLISRPSTTPGCGRSEIRGSRWPTQYCDLFFQEKLFVSGEIPGPTAIVPAFRGVHVAATKGHFSVQDKSLVLSDVTIDSRDGPLQKANSAALILAGSQRGRLYWITDGKKESIDLRIQATLEK
jgi:hypothetical protein